jgi:hypothetical protein
MADGDTATSAVKGAAKGAKKIPPWALAVGGIVVIGGVIYYKKHEKAPNESNATPTADQGLTNQSFIPVTGEGGGVGAVGSSVGGTEATGSLIELLKSQTQESKEQNQQIRQELKEEKTTFLETVRGLTGGGAPTSQAPAGSVSATPGTSGSAPQSSPSTPASPAPPAPAAKCPSNYPNEGTGGGNGLKCYAVTKSSQGCECHHYRNGEYDCQVKQKGKCVWP